MYVKNGNAYNCVTDKEQKTKYGHMTKAIVEKISDKDILKQIHTLNAWPQILEPYTYTLDEKKFQKMQCFIHP